MWYKNLGRSFYRFVTIHACDRQTDRRTEFSSLDRVCIPCSAVKTGAKDKHIIKCTFKYRNLCEKFLICLSFTNCTSLQHYTILSLKHTHADTHKLQTHFLQSSQTDVSLAALLRLLKCKLIGWQAGLRDAQLTVSTHLKTQLSLQQRASNIKGLWKKN